MARLLCAMAVGHAMASPGPDAAGGGTATCPAGAASCAAAGPPANGSSSPYFWPQARGHPGQYGTSPIEGPRKLPPRASWIFHHPRGRYDHILVGGALMDGSGSFYVAFMDGIRKLSPTGDLLWTYTAPNAVGIQGCPSLMDGAVFGQDVDGHIFRLDMETGREQWLVRPYPSAGADNTYVAAHDGVVLAGVEAKEVIGGCTKILGLNGSDGREMWSFVPDTATWNFMAMIAGDGTFVFQDYDSRAYRLGLHDGRLLWKAGGSNGDTWTDGGAVLGPNNVVYAVGTAGTQMQHHPDLPGIISARAFADGKLLWQHTFKRPIYTFPAVGDLRTGDGLSVVIGTGAMPGPPLILVMFWAAWLLGFWPRVFWGCCCLRGGCRKLPRRAASYLLAMLAGSLVGTLLYWLTWLRTPVFKSELWAMNADTGAVQWHYDLPENEKKVSAGDPEGFPSRTLKGIARSACLPATFGSPTVDGRGVVYIGYIDGKLYEIQDSDRDGFIDAGTEVATYDAGAAFLHSGPAFAPGTLAITSCDSLHVFNF